MLLPDFDVCYRAVSARDARFDGWFFTAVRTTGIYCRPSCPAITPKPGNVEFHPSAAAAQRAGFRACKRCRPDAAPGSPEWNLRGDLAGRALRLIADGVVDRDGVPGLARRLGYSERQVHRALVAEVGAGPIALARAQRAQTARVLLETTGLPVTDVAFAAGFASVRQFNETVRAVFATSPTGLRATRRRGGPAEAGTISLRLPYRAPMDLSSTLGFLARRAVSSVEQPDGDTFRRVLRAAHGPALVTLTQGDGAVRCDARLTDLRDLVTVVTRVRRLLDLDADPEAVDAVLGAGELAPLVARRPGLRAPGAVDGFEMAVRAVVGQQVSLVAARTLLGRLARDHGEVAFDGEPWRLFPSAERLAGTDPATLPVPRARGRTLHALADAVACGQLDLDPAADREQTRARLLALPGVGAWTAGYLRMRALSEPDVLLASDLGVRRAARALGLDLGPGRGLDLGRGRGPGRAGGRPAGRPDWAPWRTFATHHLWAALAESETR